MIVFEPAGMEADRVNDEGARGLLYRGPFTARPFSINHVMIEPGGNSRRHSHPWEQANYVLRGSGELETPAGRRRIKAGQLIFFSAGEEHCFENIGDEPLILLGILGPESQLKRKGRGAGEDE